MRAHADEGTTPPAKLETIQVTGSSIRRADIETSSPVQVISAAELAKSGYTSVSDVLRNISANNQGTLSQSFGNAFAAGASGIALRGLTVGATLVLIDGHRMTPYPLSDDGQRSFVDISAIPFDAIDSVEVLKDGASSIYGSDAVAGVVNIKLKKSFKGTRINVDAGISSRGDGGDQHISITHGMGDLAADGHTGFFSAEYRHQNQILYNNRSSQYTSRDFTPYGGVNLTPGVANVLNGGLQILPGGGTINANGVQTPLSPTCTAQNQYGYACPFSLNQLQLQPNTHNLNLLGKFTQSLANDWEATFGASMFSSAAEQFSQIGLGQGSTGYPTGILAISAGPGLSPTIQPLTGPVLVTVPTTGDYLNALLPGNAANHTKVDTQTYRLTADVAGAAYGWNLDFAGGFSRALLHGVYTGSVSLPGLSSILAANSTANAAQLYAALNAPANQAVLSPTTSMTSTSELDYVSAHGDREIFKFPWAGGGSAALGVGLEYTHKALNSLNPPEVAAGTVTGGVSYAVGEQDTASAYFELDSQLLKNLEVDVSGRIDSVNTFGTARTPKFGFKYTPVEQVTLRGTYARGFRAPNPAEAGQSGSVFLANSVPDPRLCPGGDPTVAGVYPSQCAVQIPGLATSNPQLKPEKSSSYTFGVIFEPITGYSVSADYYKIKITDQIVSGSAALPFSTFLNNAVRLSPVALPQLQADGTTAVTTPQFGPIAYVTIPYVNANSTMTSGIDLDFQAHFNLGEQGRLSTDLNVTHVFHYELTAGGNTYELAGTHGPLSISGDTGTPQTRATLNVTWDKGPLQASVNVNYISHYGVTDPSQGYTTCASGIAGVNGAFLGGPVPSNVCSIPSFTTFDLFGSYQLTKQLKVRGSVVNAFDRGAPLDLATYGGVSYNPALHQAGAVGRFFSVGATYDF